MARKNPETKLVESSMDWLNQSFPGYWMKNHGNVFQRPGRPDVEGVTQGMAIAIEFKRPGEDDIPELQVSYLEDFAKAGGISIGPINSIGMLEDELYKAIRMYDRINWGGRKHGLMLLHGEPTAYKFKKKI